MKHPSSKAAFKVAERLKNLPLKNMSMMDGSSTLHGCAGCQYFATADKETQKREKEKYAINTKMVRSPDFCNAFINDETMTSYSIGANMMARDLGFEYKNQLEKWALNNPEIWGNDSGIHMFGGDTCSYTSNPRENMTTQIFYEHWLGVAQRLKLLEDKEKEKKKTKKTKDKITEEINQITSPTHTQQKELA